MTHGDVPLGGSAGLLGAQPMALGWLIVALSCHRDIYTLLISPLSTPNFSRSGVTAFKGKATKQRIPWGVCLPYIFAL